MITSMIKNQAWLKPSATNTLQTTMYSGLFGKI
jgi:hypothetical protein